MTFTDIEIDTIVDFLRMEKPLPKELKNRLLFQCDNNMHEESPICVSRYSGMTLHEAREILEKDLILRALSKHGNIVKKAALDLGITRPTLYVLMDKLKIPKPKPDAKVYGKSVLR
jgi:DNA-binding NtrC family response regulator